MDCDNTFGIFKWMTYVYEDAINGERNDRRIFWRDVSEKKSATYINIFSFFFGFFFLTVKLSSARCSFEFKGKKFALTGDRTDVAFEDVSHTKPTQF